MRWYQTECSPHAGPKRGVLINIEVEIIDPKYRNRACKIPASKYWRPLTYFSSTSVAVEVGIGVRVAVAVEVGVQAGAGVVIGVEVGS